MPTLLCFVRGNISRLGADLRRTSPPQAWHYESLSDSNFPRQARREGQKRTITTRKRLLSTKLTFNRL